MTDIVNTATRLTMTVDRWFWQWL